MKNSSKIYIWLFLLVITNLFANTVDKRVIRVCTNPNWTPIEFIQNNKPQGISIDILNILSQNKKFDLKYIKTTSWSQSQQFLKDKKCDILPAAIKTKNREIYANFTKPYLKYTLAIITKDDKPLVSSLDTIANKTMSRKKDTGLIFQIQTQYPNIKIIQTKGYEEAFEKVSKGEVYFTIATLPVLSYYKNKLSLDKLQIAGYTKMRYDLSIAVRNDDIELLNILDKALEDIDETTYKMISDKWTKKHIEFKTNYTVVWQIVAIFTIILLIVLYFLIKQNKLKKEIEELNKTLQDNITIVVEDLKKAQKLAKIGSWNFNHYENRLFWSEETYDIFGIDKDKEEVTKIEDLIRHIHPEDLSMVTSAFDKHIDTKEPYRIVHRIITANNEIKYVEERCESTINKDNDSLISNGTVQDITEQKLLEQEMQIKNRQLFQQSRLAQMGEMISMIAHQWRQPLAAISSTSSALCVKATLHKLDDKMAIELSDKISNYSAHLSSTIDDFREFFKDNKKKEDTTYSELISTVLNIIEVSISNKNITLIKNLNSTMVFHTYPNELKQVILNLIKNAEDILVENNTINPRIIIETNENILTISDNGGGISNEIIDKIFDPYFSTKTKKDGTGLGLYMSKTIIEEHCDGKLEVENTQDGAMFKIILNNGFKI